MSAPLHIWITGAGQGIGAAIASQLGTQHHITLSGRHETSLRGIADTLPRGHASVVTCNVSDEQSIQQAHADAVAVFGPVDVLVNNAGIGVYTNLEDMSIQDFDEQISVNLRGVFICTKSVLPSMLLRQRGMIITINSIASVTAFLGCTAYGASKAGALALTRSLRNEVRDRNVKVTDLLVGATDTDIWSAQDRADSGERMMQSRDVAGAVQMVVDSFDNPRTHFEEIVIRPQRGDL